MRPRGGLVLPVLALVVVAGPCALGGGLQATSQAMSEAIRQTQTAEAGAEIDPEEALLTAQAAATAYQAAAQATLAAHGTLSAEEQAATATAVAPILADLVQYGVDPSIGRMGWLHPPATLEIRGYKQFDYENQFLTILARDLVVSADITWNTTTGLSGCGFVLRSNGDLQALDQYMVIATRGANGHVGLITLADGDVVNVQDIYAFGKDPLFQWRNDTTNRLTVIGRGHVFTIYSNGTRIDEIDASKPPVLPYIPPPVKPPDESDTAAMEEYQEAQQDYEEQIRQAKADYQARRRAYLALDRAPLYDLGFVALVGLSESGRAICQFHNAWLWLMN